MKTILFSLLFSAVALAAATSPEMAWNEDVNVVPVLPPVQSLVPVGTPNHVSPFCPTLHRVAKPEELVSIPNMHDVLNPADEGVTVTNKVMRSNSPYFPAHVADVIEQGITKVIVYKEFYKEEQRDALDDLYRINGFTGELQYLDMPWAPNKNTGIFNFVSACKMTIQAMIAIKDATGPVLFHCTVGEDRTGMLAGLLRVVFQGWEIEKAFRKEMCARGYEAGNPKKTSEEVVIKSVRAGLTPLYLKMATAIAKNNGELSETLCDNLPTAYIANIKPEDLICDTVPVEDPSICTK